MLKGDPHEIISGAVCLLGATFSIRGERWWEQLFEWASFECKLYRICLQSILTEFVGCTSFCYHGLGKWWWEVVWMVDGITVPALCSPSHRPPVTGRPSHIDILYLVPLLWPPNIVSDTSLSLDCWRLYWLVLDSETVGMWGGYVRAIPREVREIGWTACWAVGSSGCPPFLASERQQQTEDWRLLLQRMQRLQKGMLGVWVGGRTFGNLKWEHQLDTRLLWSDRSRTNQFVSPVNILVPCSPIQMNGRCG